MRGVIRDEDGNIVAEQTLGSLDALVAWGESTISYLRDGNEKTARALLAKDADGALYSGMAIQVEGNVEDTLNRLGMAISGGNPLPRLNEKSGMSATGIWMGQTAVMQPVVFQSVGGQIQSTGESATSDIYEEGLAGVKKMFGVAGKLENDGQPLGEILYAPILEPDNPDTMGFIAG